MKRIAFPCISFFFIILLTQCNNAGPAANNDDSISSVTETVTGNFDAASWKLGVQMWTFNHFTFAEALDKVDSAGIKSIEAYPGQKLGAGMPGEFGIGMNAGTRAKLKKLLESKGISIVALGVIAPEKDAEWKQFFDLAKEFGLSYITCEPRDDQWNIVDSMSGVYGIKIAIHDHPKPNHYWSPDSVLAATQGHPNIGSVADVGHWARNGLNPVDCLKKLEGHVYGVHLKDIKVFDNPQAEDTAVSHGVIDFPAIFAELKRQNFKGMLSIEQESNWLHSLTDIIATKKYYEEQVAKLK